ncbi:MAG: NADH-quinone oxidoreductase subunit NuoE [Alphaproteobacteria bacterium]|nr:NADH-quinone oxidoreductase subunit NuoE [Alphaproteobacteria bacterium]
MSGHEFAEEQPANWEFTPDNAARADDIIARYPPGRQASAVIPLLDLAQRQNDNWLPLKAVEAVAERLDMPRIRVLEVATFYTMFNLKPVGRYYLQACTTTPCWLRGSDQVMRCIRDRLGIGNRGSTGDGMFSLLEVECLGACVNAPILQVNDDYYEDLDYELTGELLDALGRGEPPPPGSMAGRNLSESSAGATTLTGLRPASPGLEGE